MANNEKSDYRGEGIPKFYISEMNDFDQIRDLKIHGGIKVVIDNDITLKPEEHFEPVDMSYYPYPILVVGSKAYSSHLVKYKQEDECYKISGLGMCKPEESCGLFSKVGSSITFRDLKLVNCVALGGDNVGLLVGEANDNVVCLNVTSQNCNVSGNKNVGGLVGKAPFVGIADSVVVADVIGSLYAGGFVGNTDKLKIEESNVERPVIYRDLAEETYQSFNDVTGFVGSAPKVSYDKRSYNRGIKVENFHADVPIRKYEKKPKKKRLF